MSTPTPDRMELTHRLEASGLRAGVAAAAAARFAVLLDRLAQNQPGRRRDAWFVPGRIEVLGKHTDYAGGRSLVCAVERGLCVVAAPRTDRIVAIFDLPRGSSIELTAEDEHPAVKWGVYPLTVLRRLARNFPGPLCGADIVIDSDLPSAAGLSSSSALMIATLLVLVRVNSLDDTTAWRRTIHSAEDLAAYAATIENGSSFGRLTGDRGVGTEGGSQDHTAILCSAADEIVQYAFRPTRRERAIPLAPTLTFAIAVSGVRAQKTGNAMEHYNRASRSARRILEHWNVDSQRHDETLAAAIASSPDAVSRMRLLAARDGPRLLHRFDQFVEESGVLVPTAGDRLARGDLAGFGAAVARSQALAEQLLKNQVPETASLARLAREQGALAASAFGAGFGGSVWALVERDEASAFLNRWQNAYASAHADASARSLFFLTRPGPAAFRLVEP
jgi:galactokinase